MQLYGIEVRSAASDGIDYVHQDAVIERVDVMQGIHHPVVQGEDGGYVFYAGPGIFPWARMIVQYLSGHHDSDHQ
jgi:hypothetical protein